MEIPQNYRRSTYVFGGFGLLTYLIPQFLKWFNVEFVTLNQWFQRDASMCACVGFKQ